MKINGTNITLIIDGQEVSHANSCDFDVSMDMPDASDKQSLGWAEHLQGLRSYSVSSEAFVNYEADQNIEDRINDLIARGRVALLIQHKGVANKSWVVRPSTANVSGSFNMEETSGFSCEFTGDGFIELVLNQASTEEVFSVSEENRYIFGANTLAIDIDNNIFGNKVDGINDPYNLFKNTKVKKTANTGGTSDQPAVNPNVDRYGNYYGMGNGVIRIFDKSLNQIKAIQGGSGFVVAGFGHDFKGYYVVTLESGTTRLLYITYESLFAMGATVTISTASPTGFTNISASLSGTPATGLLFWYNKYNKVAYLSYRNGTANQFYGYKEGVKIYSKSGGTEVPRLPLTVAFTTNKVVVYGGTNTSDSSLGGVHYDFNLNNPTEFDDDGSSGFYTTTDGNVIYTLLNDIPEAGYVLTIVALANLVIPTSVIATITETQAKRGMLIVSKNRVLYHFYPGGYNNYIL
jgi:hypothetical protein